MEPQDTHEASDGDRVVVVPTIGAIQAQMDTHLRQTVGLSDARIDTIWELAGGIRYCAKNRGKLGEEWAREEIGRCDDAMRAILCTTPLGVRAPYPDDFWQTPLGRLIFYTFEVAYGPELLTQRQVADALGHTGRWGVSRVAQLQRIGALDYVIDPDADERVHSRRRVTVDMLRRYQAAKGGEDDAED